LLILLIAVVGRLFALLRHSTLLSPTSILTEASRTYHSIVARIVGFSVQHRSHHAPDEAATTKQSYNNPSHLVTHPLHRKARQRQSRAKPGEHLHPRPHHHHQYMWACGITKIESCRPWVPYMRSSPPAASVAASRWRGHGMDRRQTPPCTWACNITDLHIFSRRFIRLRLRFDACTPCCVSQALETALGNCGHCWHGGGGAILV
jgi:hypothetical protein